MKKDFFLVCCVVYFAVFYVIPLFLSIFDIPAKDFGRHLRYMLYVFPFLSVIFSFLTFKVLGFSKKRLIVLLISLVLVYLISVVYMFLKLTSSFEINF